MGGRVPSDKVLRVEFTDLPIFMQEAVKKFLYPDHSHMAPMAISIELHKKQHNEHTPLPQADGHCCE
jgi:hypothetical protein